MENLANWVKRISAKSPKAKKITGSVLILIGFLALITPLTPGSWLIFVGLGLLGVQLTAWEKIMKILKIKGRMLIIIAIAVLAIGVLLVLLRGSEDLWLCQNGQWVKHGNPSAQKPTSGCGQAISEAQDPLNTSYTIDGKLVVLKNGQSEELIPDSTSKIITKIFEANTQGDINGDGLSDTAVILTQDRGGSGTFFYIAAAIKTEQGYTGTNAVLLGDRIAPQPSQIQNGEIIANYADRKPGEDFSIQPSVGKSMYLEFKNNLLVSKP